MIETGEGREEGEAGYSQCRLHRHQKCQLLERSEVFLCLEQAVCPSQSQIQQLVFGRKQEAGRHRKQKSDQGRNFGDGWATHVRLQVEFMLALTS